MATQPLDAKTEVMFRLALEMGVLHPGRVQEQIESGLFDVDAAMFTDDEIQNEEQQDFLTTLVTETDAIMDIGNAVRVAHDRFSGGPVAALKAFGSVVIFAMLRQAMATVRIRRAVIAEYGSDPVESILETVTAENRARRLLVRELADHPAFRVDDTPSSETPLPDVDSFIESIRQEGSA